MFDLGLNPIKESSNEYLKSVLFKPKVDTFTGYHRNALPIGWMRDYRNKDIDMKRVFKLDLSEAFRMLLLASTRSGKCLGKGTKIRMYDGSTKNVEDVKVGDLLMGDDSEPREVLNLGRGKEMMYRVKQSNGDDYVCNESHILSLKWGARLRVLKNIDYDDIIDISIKDYLKKSKSTQRLIKGYKVGVEYPERVVNIDPYFLGIWLADGCKWNLTISNPDKEIEKYIIDYADELGMSFSIGEYGDRCKVLRIIKKYDKHNSIVDNKLLVYMKKYDLIKNKHIPEDYMINSRKNRLQLLAGLLDGDGYTSFLGKRNGGEIVITQKDENLSNQIVELGRSLGLRVSINDSYKKCQGWKEKRKYYNINISGRIDLIPLKIKRKRPPIQMNDRSKTTIKIEKLKVDKYYGFTLDGNGRFLLEDFTVAHNTFMLRALADRMKKAGYCIVFLNDIKNEMYTSEFAVQGKFQNKLIKGEKPEGTKIKTFRPTFFQFLEGSAGKLPPSQEWASIDVSMLQPRDFVNVMNFLGLTQRQIDGMERALFEHKRAGGELKEWNDFRALIEDAEYIENSASILNKLYKINYYNPFDANYRVRPSVYLQNGYTLVLNLQDFDSLESDNGFLHVMIANWLREITDARKRGKIPPVVFIIDETARICGVGPKSDTSSKREILESIDITTGYDVNFCFANQNISTLPERLIHQCKFIGIPWNADYTVVKDAMKGAGVQEVEVKSTQYNEIRRMMSRMKDRDWMFIDKNKKNFEFITSLPPLTMVKETG